jgi:hypothetical protein
MGLLGLLVVGGMALLAQAQNPGSGQPGAIQNDQTPAGPMASFRSVPQQVIYGPTSPYYQFKGPYEGYLSGAADVINAQGGYLVNNQQALQMREQVLQSRQDTRRKTMDEWLYERAVTPTPEDEKERYRLEMLRASRDNPEPTEIWSGKSLNRLLAAIQRQQAQGIQGPSLPLTEDIIKHLNVTDGSTRGSLGLMRTGSKLSWPDVLQDTAYANNRQKVDELMAAAYQQLDSGPVDDSTMRGLKKAVDGLTVQLRHNVSDLDINDYNSAKDYLRQLDGTVAALQEPRSTSYINGKWAGKSNSVGEVTAKMTEMGLKFAPATPGDQAAYTAMQQGLVTYLVWPPKPWDPFTK